MAGSGLSGSHYSIGVPAPAGAVPARVNPLLSNDRSLRKRLAMYGHKVRQITCVHQAVRPNCTMLLMDRRVVRPFMGPII